MAAKKHTTKRPVVPKKQKINPHFNIPAGMEDVWDYGNTPHDGDGSGDSFLSEGGPAVLGDVTMVDESGNGHVGPESPAIKSIYSQTIRRLSDGSQIVDVVFEVEDIPGIVKYDLRVTKLDPSQL